MLVTEKAIRPDGIRGATNVRRAIKIEHNYSPPTTQLFLELFWYYVVSSYEMLK